VNYKSLQENDEFDVYPKRGITIVRGKNSKVWDDKGNQYIDCVAGHGVANVGHCNKEVISAIKEQSELLISCPGIFYNDKKALLLEKLLSIVPKNLKRAFLCNSGTESVEAAIKFARITTGKTDFIAAMKGFHGRTLGALSATHNPKHRNDFLPLIEGFKFVPLNNFEKLLEKVNLNTAGIILEIIQGEGGINIGKNEYFEKIQKLCKEKNILLVVDEVQTGFGRTGKMFASEHYDLLPDIMCVAKAIAGGIPLGAVLCSERIIVPKGKHGSTFGGNPLSCAAAIATIEYIINNNLVDNSFEKGSYVTEKLKTYALSKVRKIRGLGLMIGIELKEKAKPYIEELLDKKVLVLPAGSTVIRLLPPLTISYEDLDFVIETMVEILE
jgi:acetylornithine/LysW-gamma-L-lysine aminotransferase